MKLIACYISSAFIQTTIYNTIFLTYHYSHMAGLNIGIASSVWAIAPFTSALAEWIVFGNRLQKYHVVGMNFMLTCALLISCSQLMTESSSESLVADDPSEIDSGTSLKSERVPIYVPILISSSITV